MALVRILRRTSVKPVDFDIDEAPEPDGHPVELPADFRDVKRVIEWMKNGQRDDMLEALTARAST